MTSGLCWLMESDLQAQLHIHSNDQPTWQQQLQVALVQSVAGPRCLGTQYTLHSKVTYRDLQVL